MATISGNAGRTAVMITWIYHSQVVSRLRSGFLQTKVALPGCHSGTCDQYNCTGRQNVVRMARRNHTRMKCAQGELLHDALNIGSTVISLPRSQGFFLGLESSHLLGRHLYVLPINNNKQHRRCFATRHAPCSSSSESSTMDHTDICVCTMQSTQDATHASLYTMQKQKQYDIRHTTSSVIHENKTIW